MDDHAAPAVHRDHEADGAAKALMKGGDAVLGTHTSAGALDRDDPSNAGPATQAFLDQLDAALGGEAARLSAAAGPRVRLPLFHPALFEVAAGQNWGVSMVSLRVRDVPVVVTLAGHLPEIPADALNRSSQLQCVRLPVPASSRRSSPTPPRRPLGAVISDSVWGASVVDSGAGERRA